MEWKRLMAAALCAVLVFGLAGCGKGGDVVEVDETKQLPTDVLDGSKTTVDNEGDAAEDVGDMPAIDPLLGSGGEDDDFIDPSDAGDLGPSGQPGDDPLGDGDPSLDDDPLGDGDPLGDDDDDGDGDFSVSQPGRDDDGADDGNGEVNRPGAGGEEATGNKSGTKYRFQKYVLDGAEDGNFVFSGEAILRAVDIWSEMAMESDHQAFEKYLVRDYLGYESDSTLQFLSRIWVDEPHEIGNGAARLSKMFTAIDMQDDGATAEKDAWASDKTGGYIDHTPSQLTDSTRLDIAVVPFLKDEWDSGLLAYDVKAKTFNNKDGTETRTRMFWNDGLTYWDMDNALAYCMYLEGGNYVMFILPNEGVDMEDVDVSGLMAGKYASKKAHVAFYCPSFETETEHTLNLRNFGLSAGRVATNVLSDIPKGFEPQLTQLAKISFSPYGVGPMAPEEDPDPLVSTPPAADDYSDDLDFVRIVLNRPFMYYVGDYANEDVAFFGVMNTLPEDQVVKVD